MTLVLIRNSLKYIKIKKYFYLSFIGDRISQILLKSVISELITYLSQKLKSAHFCPNDYKGIVLKIRVRNTPFSAFTILLLKNTDFHPYFYKGIVLKIGVQNGLF